MNCWNDFTKQMIICPATPTLASLRQPDRYWIVSDTQLKRDLRGRTLADVYRENRAGRWSADPKYQPRSAKPDSHDWHCLLRDYGDTMRALRGPQWRPHPASVDPEHAIAKQREGLRHVKREVVNSYPQALKAAARRPTSRATAKQPGVSGTATQPREHHA